MASQSTFLSNLVLPDFVFDTSDPTIDHLSNWEYLAHHLPGVTYAGLMRMLADGQGAAKPDACTLAALAAPSCVVSSVCSAALRPAGADKCRGCASDATCTGYWGMAGGRCDRSWSELSGWMCYKTVPGWAGVGGGRGGGCVAACLPPSCACVPPTAAPNLTLTCPPRPCIPAPLPPA